MDRGVAVIGHRTWDEGARSQELRRTKELLEQTGGRIDAFCGAVGTGGMVRGVAQALRQGRSRARIVALEPSSSPALTEGRGGAHSVEGTATRSVPPHMADKPYDEARAIDEAEARLMAWRLAREERLLVGTSSGLNIAAAIHLAREVGTGKVVATSRSMANDQVGQGHGTRRQIPRLI